MAVCNTRGIMLFILFDIARNLTLLLTCVGLVLMKIKRTPTVVLFIGLLSTLEYWVLRVWFTYIFFFIGSDRRGYHARQPYRRWDPYYDIQLSVPCIHRVRKAWWQLVPEMCGFTHLLLARTHHSILSNVLVSTNCILIITEHIFLWFFVNFT